MPLPSSSSKATSTSVTCNTPCELLDRTDNVSYVQIYSSCLEFGFFFCTSALYHVLTCNFLSAVLAHRQTSQLLLQDLPIKSGPNY